MSEVKALPVGVPKIVKLSDQVEYNGTQDYPLKLRMQLRNDSAEPIDVQVQDYRPGLITLKRLATEVLQVRLASVWLPGPHGAGRVAVFPTQQFQAWVGLDEGRFGKGQVEEHRGKIGTLVLLVNGQHVDIPL